MAGLGGIRTLSKRKGATIVFDGESVIVGGYTPDRDPVVQVKALSTWLRSKLRDMTGREFLVRSVLVYPGWFVDQATGAQKSIWVLEPKALPKWIAKERVLLSKEDQALIIDRLNVYCRSLSGDGRLRN